MRRSPPAPRSPDGVLTVEETATRLAVSVTTVWRWIAAGRLHPTRLLARTVVSVEEVALLMEEQARRADPTRH